MLKRKNVFAVLVSAIVISGIVGNGVVLASGDGVTIRAYNGTGEIIMSWEGFDKNRSSEEITFKREDIKEFIFYLKDNEFYEYLHKGNDKDRRLGIVARYLWDNKVLSNTDDFNANYSLAPSKGSNGIYKNGSVFSGYIKDGMLSSVENKDNKTVFYFSANSNNNGRYLFFDIYRYNTSDQEMNKKHFYANTPKIYIDGTTPFAGIGNLEKTVFSDNSIYFFANDDVGLEKVLYKIIDSNSAYSEDTNGNEISNAMNVVNNEVEVASVPDIFKSSGTKDKYYKIDNNLDPGTYKILRIQAVDKVGRIAPHRDYTLIKSNGAPIIKPTPSFANYVVFYDTDIDIDGSNTFYMKEYKGDFNDLRKPAIRLGVSNAVNAEKMDDKAITSKNKKYSEEYNTNMNKLNSVYIYLSDQDNLTDEDLSKIEINDKIYSGKDDTKYIDATKKWVKANINSGVEYDKINGKTLYIMATGPGGTTYAKAPKVVKDTDVPEFVDINDKGTYDQKHKFDVKDMSGGRVFLDYKFGENVVELKRGKDGKFSLEGVPEGSHTLMATDNVHVYPVNIKNKDFSNYIQKKSITINVKKRASTGTYISDPTNPDVSDFTPASTTRVSGANRIGTSLSLSEMGFKSADTVYLVSGKNNIDALSSAGATDGKSPILYTDKYSVPEDVIKEIKRLGAKNINIIGGENSIDNAVIDNLSDQGYKINRIHGVDRYDTSAKIAEEILKNNNQKKAIIASGQNFADALSISGYSAKSNIPVLLVTRDTVPEQIMNVMIKYGITDIEIVGGVNSVSKNVEDAIKSIKLEKGRSPKIIDRIVGVDRYDTSLKVAQKYFKGSDKVYMASGQNPADALVVGPLSGKNNMPIILTKKSEVPSNIKPYLKGKNVVIVGGENTIEANSIKKQK